MGMSAHAAARPEPDQKPFYHFRGELPAALAHLRDQPRWVAWNYVRKRGRWTKPPIDARTGRLASVSNPATWATFDVALAGMERHGLAGVGLVLIREDDIGGIDLDHCINDADNLSELAAEIVGYGETYAEISPSGEGIRLFMRGKVAKAMKDDAKGIEVYGTGRYLTVTGQQIPDTPDRIAEAPRTLARLTAVAEVAREGKKRKSNGDARPQGADFFRSVNDTALANLDEWVPGVLRSAVKQATGAWRVTSKDLGREYEEDLSIHRDGINDFGPEKGLTPIDIMIEYGGAPDATAAAMWLCERMGIDPARLGWKPDRPHVRSKGHAPQTNGSEPAAWPDPARLPDGLLPVAPFDFEMLPEKVRPWVKDVSERMQAPPDFAGVAVMAALGSLIGRKVAVRPKLKDCWAVIANLWALLIGLPGVMKSPTQNAMLQPLKLLAVAAREKFNLEKAKYEMDVAAAKVRQRHNDKEAAQRLADGKTNIDDLIKPITIQEPTLKRYMTTNASYESLAELMRQNPNGLLIDRDEMLSLLDRLDEDGRADERGFYLTGWNGDSSYTVDRIGRGFDLHVRALCISMVGGTQPARISQYLARVRRGASSNDGLVQRFGLMVWPDIPPEWKNIDREPNKDAYKKILEVFNALDKLDALKAGTTSDAGPAGSEECIPYVRFSNDAHNLFLAWRSELERRLHSGSLEPMIEGHLAKYRSLIPALALICHFADGHTGDVSDAAVKKALKWATYLESHAVRVYASSTLAAADAARAIIAKVKSGHLKAQFGSREIVRAQWSMLRDRETIHAALQLLVDHDWLGAAKVETPGRTATVYSVNPKVLAALKSVLSGGG